MQTFFLIFLSLLLITALVGIYLLYKKFSQSQQPKEGEQNLFVMLQNQIQELNRQMESRMNENSKAMNDTRHNLNQTIQDQMKESVKLIQGITGQSNKMIADITEKLTSVDKTNQQVIGFSQQLTNLEKVLTSQKTRGNLGEAGLQLVLENILPPTAYQLQYTFEDGDTVDAIVKTKDGITDIIQVSSVNISGNLPTSEGLHIITIKAEDGFVQITSN